MKAEIQILKGARELLSDPNKWTKGTLARAAGGRPVHPGSEVEDDPVCFCTIGALCNVSRREFGLTAKAEDAVWQARLALTATLRERDSGATGVATFNDDPTTTHADVLRLFDDTLACLEVAHEGE